MSDMYEHNNIQALCVIKYKIRTYFEQNPKVFARVFARTVLAKTIKDAKAVAKKAYKDALTSANSDYKASRIDCLK